ncbi:MAG: U32 family peptidase, partial [Acholeplasmataceae bacterium]|nr:U32 family peptidase [Acholeplasmataceae bacterium]
MIELLAPAGDLEKLKIAYLYGADACYIGGEEFSLRARASNFALKEIKEGALFAHQLKKKLYVTLNIVPHNENLKELIPYLKALEEAAVDG